jgi:hypothetical protein
MRLSRRDSSLIASRRGKYASAKEEAEFSFESLIAANPSSVIISPSLQQYRDGEEVKKGA